MAAFAAAYNNFQTYTNPCHFLAATAAPNENHQTSTLSQPTSTVTSSTTTLMPTALPTPPSDPLINSIKHEPLTTVQIANNNQNLRTIVQDKTADIPTSAVNENCSDWLQ